MRPLLDEHYSPEIARQLRARGHDVVAVAERADLTGRTDSEIFRRMAGERRAIMTNDVKDFMPLIAQAALDGDDHYGLLLRSDRSMPRRSDAIGSMVEALGVLMRCHQDEDSCRNRAPWAGPPTRGQGRC